MKSVRAGKHGMKMAFLCVCPKVNSVAIATGSSETYFVVAFCRSADVFKTLQYKT